MPSIDLQLWKPDSEYLYFYWILIFPAYPTFVIYATEDDAAKYFIEKNLWEGGGGLLRKANPENRDDVKLVREEIINVRLDKQSGIKDLPFLPARGWL